MPDPGVLGLPLAAVLAYLCGTHANARLGGAAAGLLLLALLAAFGIPDGTPVPIVICVAAPFAAGRGVRSRRLLVAQLAARNRELAEAEAEHTALAVQGERARIARELHDILSHTLAVIAVQAGAGRVAAPEQPDAAAARFAAIGAAGRRALVEMGRLADVLGERAEEDRIAAVLAEAAEAGLTVRAAALVPEAELPPAVADIAYRTVQEGVTNALRHAPGSELHVTLGAAGDDLVVELRDTGPARADGAAGPGAGLGLAGLRERVAEAGGQLEAGPADGGGWRLRAALPAPAPAA